MGILKNGRQERFCHLVATGSKAYQAYIDAGYSAKGARGASTKLQAKAYIDVRIKEIQDNIEKTTEAKVGISKSWIVDKLQKIVIRCMQEEPVLDREGNRTGEYKFEHSGANKALELLGKELGMYQGRDASGNPGDPNAPRAIIMVVERPIKPEIEPYTDITATEIEAPEAV